MPRKHGDFVLVEDTRSAPGATTQLQFGLVTHVPVGRQRRFCNYAACVLLSDAGECVYVVSGGRYRIVNRRTRLAAPVHSIAPRTTPRALAA